MAKTKKYYKNYYANNKDRINENKRMRRARKQLDENLKKVDEINEARNNHDRILSENLKQSKNHRDIFFYEEKIKSINRLLIISFIFAFSCFVASFVVVRNDFLWGYFVSFGWLFLFVEIIASITAKRTRNKLINLKYPIKTCKMCGKEFCRGHNGY